MKITTQHVPKDCDYLTNGKEYEVYRLSAKRQIVTIVDDNFGEVEAHLYGCAHLNGQAWDIIKENTDD